MLCVRIDGREVDVSPAPLARLILAGKLDRYSPSRIPGGTAARPLDQSMGPPQCEALTTELLECLRRMYAPDMAAIDVQELRARVEDLCQWCWESPYVAARLFWTAAWLNELTGHGENAISFYDAFLQMACGENHLRLLAWNNRGVLRIRLGRLEGVRDLLRAAIPSADQEADAAPAAGPPAACFNLLNLINACLGVEPLVQVVDKELAEFFSPFSPERGAFWLGQESGAEGDDAGDTASYHADGWGARLRILRDPTFRRLNTLTTRLAAHARQLAGGDRPAGVDRSLSAISQLALWDSCAGPMGQVEETGRSGVPFATNGNYERYAEAAGLLLREDIPSTLTKLDNPLVRAEQFAQEELADIESHLALNRWELLRPRLQVQRAILSSLNRQGRVTGLIVRIEVQLERIAQLEAQREQAELQKACGRLISEVERFRTVIDRHQADREFEEFENRLEQLRTRLAAAAGGDMAVLLDELSARVQGHLRRLRRLEIRRAIREPLRHLRRHWPTDWAVPVSESLYRALAQCAVSDPEGLVRDWAALEERLDAHQGQYHFHRVLSALQSNSMSWDAVSGDLVEALRLRPDLWPAMGPLFGFSGGTTPGRQEMTPEMRVSLEAAAKRLFEAGSQEADTCRDSVHRAAGVLEQTLRRIEGEKWLRLWRQVEATLSPLLARMEVETISRAQMLAERCLDAWPAGPPGRPGPADPRHPVNLFLESCVKARCLVEAEQSLNARPPRYAEAQERFLEAVESGMDTEDRIRRTVTGLYLAGFHEKDAPQVQRHVLAGLEAWCRTVSEGTGQRLSRGDVVEAIAQVREKILAGRSMAEVKRTSSGGSLPHETEDALAGRGCGEGDPEADQSDTGKEGVAPEI